MSYLTYIGVERIPKNYWDNFENVKHFMSFVAWQNNLVNVDDWYKITQKSLTDLGISKSIFKNKNTLIKILTKLYDNQIEWLPWKFRFSTSFWAKLENRKCYLEWLFKELKFESMEDWYKITTYDFRNNCGGTLLEYYDNSPFKTLTNFYPEYEFLPWKFTIIKHNFWNKLENQRIYMNWLFKELNYETMEDWYKITQNDFKENYGSSLITIYITILKIFNTIYPEYKWLPWIFPITKGFWNDINNQKWYLEWLFKELKFSSFEDFYSLSNDLICKNYGATLMSTIYCSPVKMLIAVYPEYKWDIKRFSFYKGEAVCKIFLETIDSNVIWTFCTNWCKNELTQRHYRFDFLLPKYSIIVEVDGEQHFTQVQNWTAPEINRERDIHKMKLAIENGYSVIRVLQDDISKDKNDWKEKLRNLIKKYDVPQIIYTSPRYEEYYKI